MFVSSEEDALQPNSGTEPEPYSKDDKKGGAQKGSESDKKPLKNPPKGQKGSSNK